MTSQYRDSLKKRQKIIAAGVAVGVLLAALLLASGADGSMLSALVRAECRWISKEIHPDEKGSDPAVGDSAAEFILSVVVVLVPS